VCLCCLIAPFLPAQASDPDFAGFDTQQIEDFVSSDQSLPEQTASEQPEERLAIEVLLSPAQPVLNIRWSVTILAEYPYPANITVRQPIFPDALMLEEMRTEPYVNQERGGRRWTSISFIFTPQSAEDITLEPFEIIAPGKHAATEPINARILRADPLAKKYSPSLVWDTPKMPFKIGEATELTLRLLDWNPAKPRPKNLFRFEVPEQTILEEQPLTGADISRNVALRLTLIPLSGSEIAIPRARFQEEGVNLEIPRLNLKVLPKDALTNAPQERQTVKEEPHVQVEFEPQFPQTLLKMPFFFKKNADIAIRQAKIEWDHGKKAEALVIIRRMERDSTAGPSFTSLRKDMEAALRINLAQDESWFPKKLSLILFFILLSALIFIIILWVARKKARKGFTICLTAILAALAYGFWGGSQSKEAVLRETEVFHVPENTGTASFRFGDGQSAAIRSISGSWAFVETFDNRSGWVLIDSVIQY
jgi:hypothetical protein